MNAYITYLTTNNYTVSVLTLWESLKETNTKYPFYCMVNKKVSDFNINLLKKQGIKIIYAPIITLPENLINYDKKYCKSGFEILENYFQKLLIFGLDKFKKLVYLDADMIVLHNIDELFEKPHMSAVLDHLNEKNDYLLSGGLIVIEPSKDFFKLLMTSLKNMSESYLYEHSNSDHHAFWDTDFYYAFNPNWGKDDFNKILDLKYNAFIHSFQFYKDIKKEEVKVLHLTSEKIWLMETKKLYTKIINNEFEYYFIKKYLYFYLKTLENIKKESN